MISSLLDGTCGQEVSPPPSGSGSEAGLGGGMRNGKRGGGAVRPERERSQAAASRFDRIVGRSLWPTVKRFSSTSERRADRESDRRRSRATIPGPGRRAYGLAAA